MPVDSNHSIDITTWITMICLRLSRGRQVEGDFRLHHVDLEKCFPARS
jgi:hypothetical protein